MMKVLHQKSSEIKQAQERGMEMAVTEREVFRDFFLEKKAISESEDLDLKPEELGLSDQEKNEMIRAWDVDDNLSQERIKQLEKEIIEAEQVLSPPKNKSEEALESGFEDERDDGSQLYIKGWVFPTNRKEIEQDFIKDYESYVLTHDPDIEHMLENRMIVEMNQLCTYKIYLRIRYHYGYSWGEETRIAHDAHENLVEDLRERKHGVVKKNRKRKEKKELFSTGLEALRYYQTIYRNKTMNYFRDWKQNHNKMLSLPSETELQEHPKTYKGFTENIKTQDSTKLSKEYHAQVRELLMLYLWELLDYDREPSLALAGMYARVLYQVEPILDGDVIVERIKNEMRKSGWSLDPNSDKYDRHWQSAKIRADEHPAGASPAWAIERMGTRTIEALTNESEWSLQRCVYENMGWGNAMRKKLKEEAKGYAPACWGELIYTKCFTQNDIQAGADSVHKTITGRMAKTISANRTYRQYANNVLTREHPLMKRVIAETNKRRKKARK